MKLLLSFVLLMHADFSLAAKNNCTPLISGYKVVENTLFPFFIDDKKACFFAFYTTNPDPTTDVKGNGNNGDAVWYAYYLTSSPKVIHEFPKPSDTDWSNVCTINAISFRAMYGDNKPNVTVIGSCDQNAINYNFPFVFKWQHNKYTLDEDVYRGIFGLIALTVADVRAYIKSPDEYYQILNNRNKLN